MPPSIVPPSVVPPAVVIAIPAANEAERIGGCLDALARQQGAPPFQTVVLANNCTDGTEAVARRWHDRLPHLHIIAVELPPALAHAGEARWRAMEAAARLGGPNGVLLTTDADTFAPPHWVAANLAALAAADVVAGRAVIDAADARLIPQHLHDIDARECVYAALLDELASLITPDPYDPWPRHDEHSGASIAVRVAAYLAAGGVPRQPSGEDRALIAALRRGGARIRHAPDVWVTVSGRLDGRAPGGMAETIRHRIVHPPQWLDDRLEPLAQRLRRLHLRARLQEGEMGSAIADELGLPIAQLIALARRGAAAPWMDIETASPALRSRRVAVANVELEIENATRARDQLLNAALAPLLSAAE